MTQQTRRRFLQSSLAAAATVTIAGTKSSPRVLGANETIRIAIAGLNGRGGAHVGAFAKMQGVEIAYLVDPDTRTFGKRISQVTDAGGKEPKTVQDIRRVLEDKSIDAITVATPNHWHALMTIWGCQAGKDVYVEKPCSHNIHEGRIAVEMARKHNRIVQHGTQKRGSDSWANLMAVIQSGQLGKLLVSRALCYKSRKSIGVKPVSQSPKELDFDIWTGPAPKRDFHTNLVHYNWHWFWDFGNGDIGNQGVHEMDAARWAIAGGTLPRSVFSLGGRFGYKEQGETPNTQVSVMDFGTTQLIFEVRGLPTGAQRGQMVGNIFELESGVISGTSYYPKGSDKPAPLPKVEVKHPRSDIFANFIQAVRSRKVSDLEADILEAHYSSALCHLANLSYRLGKNVPFEARTRSKEDARTLTETVERMEEHLRTNSVKLSEQTLRVGRKLSVDQKSEHFVDDAEADKLLTREYRAPYAVPEKVS
jgi:predicted dehydrogenase